MRHEETSWEGSQGGGVRQAGLGPHTAALLRLWVGGAWGRGQGAGPERWQLSSTPPGSWQWGPVPPSLSRGESYLHAKVCADSVTGAAVDPARGRVPVRLGARLGKAGWPHHQLRRTLGPGRAWGRTGKVREGAGRGLALRTPARHREASAAEWGRVSGRFTWLRLTWQVRAGRAWSPGCRGAGEQAGGQSFHPQAPVAGGFFHPRLACLALPGT